MRTQEAATLVVLLCFPFLSSAVEPADFQSPFGFVLEESTLSDVRDAYGDATVFELPESHHNFGICYSSLNSSAIVVFVSGREFGGPNEKLLAVTLHRDNVLSYPCSDTEIAIGELDIGGLSLGTTAEEFRALSNEAIEETEQGHLFLNFEYQRSLTDEEIARFESQFPAGDGPEVADVFLGTWCRITDDQTVEVGVWQTSTY